MGMFYERELNCCWVYYKQIITQNQEVNIIDKVKAVLDLSNYATRNNWDLATGVNTSDLTAEKNFLALKAEVDKLDINKLVNVPTNSNNLKTNVDDCDIGKSKTVSVDLKKVTDLVYNEVVKNTKLNMLNKE